MTPQEFNDKIRLEGAARYTAQAIESNPAWPYINLRSYVWCVNSGKYTYEQVRDALWTQLDRFEGNAYSAFIMCEHDSGACVLRFLATGDPLVLVSPRPPDTRYAPADTALQLSYLERELDLYGNPMVEFHKNEGARKWATFASRPPYNAYDVLPETARWLLLNNLSGGGNDRYAWEPYRGKTIAEAVLIIEDVNHPGSHP